jgi:hypothetical protein
MENFYKHNSQINSESDEDEIKRGRSYKITLFRKKSHEKKEPNIVIPFESYSLKFRLNDDIIITDEKKNYIIEKLEIFNNCKYNNAWYKITKLLLIFSYLLLILSYIYCLLLIILVTLFNPMIIIINSWIIFQTVKIFIFIDDLLKERYRKKVLNQIICKENVLCNTKGLRWLVGRDGEWLELIKI